MLRRLMISIAIVITLVVIVLSAVLFRPYKAISFVVDGENWSTAVENGGEMILNLDYFDDITDWSIELVPDFFASDYCNNGDTGKEFHIIALSEGKGDMAIHGTKKDGEVERYILSLSISRHRRTHLQIDTVSFEKYE